jgi:hypothetical protein
MTELAVETCQPLYTCSALSFVPCPSSRLSKRYLHWPPQSVNQMLDTTISSTEGSNDKSRWSFSLLETGTGKTVRTTRPTLLALCSLT